MKKYPVVLFLSLLISTPLYSSPLSVEVGRSFEKLVQAYNQQYPSTGIKRGLAIIPFEENSESARSLNLGSTVRDLVSPHVVNSQIFHLVDRDTLKHTLDEITLSMLGVVDSESIIRAGRVTGVRVFLTGSISEAEDHFSITMRLVDTETGRVAAVDTITTRGRNLVDARREFAIRAIEQYGIGINFQPSVVFINSPSPERSDCYLIDVYLNYRPVLWLSLKLGVTTMSLEFEGSGLPADKIFPDAETLSGQDMTLHGGRAAIHATTFLIGVDYNYLINERFNMGFGFSFNMFERPSMRQIFMDGYYLDEDAPGDEKEKGLESGLKCNHHFESVALFRFELKPQVFILPRLTMGLVAGFILANDFRSEYVEIGDGIYDPGEQPSVDKYLGISTRNFLDGRDVNKLTLNMSWYLGFGINFFF